MGHIVFSSGSRSVPLQSLADIDREDVDPKRRATFAFARKVSRTPERVTAADVDSLRPHFTDVQIVELVFAINRYRTMNTLAEALGAPLETVNPFDPKNPTGPPPGERKGAPATDAPPGAPKDPPNRD